jgi:hypothetical protein
MSRPVIPASNECGAMSKLGMRYDLLKWFLSEVAFNAA